MCRKNSSLILLLAPIALIAIAGCPSGPVLQISPTAVSLNGSRPSALVTLSNAGSGSLSWEIEDCPAWLTLSTTSGTLAGGDLPLHINSETAGLTAGIYTGEIRIGSTGGSRSVAVVLSVVAPATLEVTPTALDFGGSESTRTLLVRNAGAGTLSWNVAGALPAGYSLSETSGSLSSGDSETVIVTLDRGTLAGGANEASITIESNGGSQTVSLSAVVQALQVTPLNMDFGAQLTDITLTITNSGTEVLNWTVDNNQVPDWLTLGSAAGTIAAGANEVVVCTADRSGVGPGVTEGQFTVASDGGSETVYVSVEGPDPVLFVTPLSLDFGSTDLDQTLTIQNTGTGTLEWTIEEGILDGATWTAQDQAWLSTAPGTGATDSGAAMDVVVTVDRSQSTPDEDTPHAAWLRVFSEDGDEAFVPVSQLTLPPTLRVLPEQLDFGTVYIRRQLAIWNGGLGTVHWRIDTSDKPAWALLTPVDGAGVASGDVAGSETDAVTVAVDRTGLDPADTDYSWTFEVTAEDDGGAEVAGRTVRVTMNVGREATIAVDTGENADGVPNIDAKGVHFLPFGTTEKTMNFTIENTGSAPLVWSIDGADFPNWLTSVSPMQGTIQPDAMSSVTVTVNREGLSFGDKTHPMIIDSNDPVNGLLPVRVELQVPKRVIIGIKPKGLDFGLYGISGTFQVANMGDPGSMLNFEVSRNKNWLYFYPETGSSEGTADVIKNWVDVNVSIDRGQLDGTGGSGELLVRAYETDADGKRIYPKEVDEEVVNVSVEAAALSFESAWARLRIPSLVRFVLLMRDIAYEPIQLAYENLSEVLAGINVYERDTLIDPYETNKFLKLGDDLKTDLVILLDYSGSMYQSAQQVLDPAVAGSDDPLQAIYNECIGNLIQELPDNYNIALMEFHDRAQITRLVLAPDYGPAFINDKSDLLARLHNINVVDHGATELLPAVVDAAAELLFKESQAARVPFDDADVRGVLCVSDGRLTTPPGKVKDVIDVLWPTRVRFFGLGWGDDILHEPLARLAAGTGGHYYPTATVATGEVNEDDEPVMVPALESMFDWCQTVDPAVDPTDQSIPKDLKSQVVFSYATLTEDTGVKVRLDAAFDNPNDDDPTSINGSLNQKNFDFVSIRGDTHLGQISMRSDGIAEGYARVVIRGEYMPRGVNRLQFSLSCAEGAFIVTQAPAESGGLVEDWAMTVEGNVVTLESDGDALSYGSYGDLLYLDFEGLPPETTLLTVALEVLDPVWHGEEFDKYFTYPDTIQVGLEPVLAPAFPTPKTDVDWLDFGTAGTEEDIILRNIGGSHSPTEVWLDWVAPQSGGTLSVHPSSGRLISTTQEASIHLEFSRTGPAGDYWDFILIECSCGSLNQSYVLQIPVFYTVLEPVLELASSSFIEDNVLDFGDADEEMYFEVVNAGQGTLDWSIDATNLPAWMGLSSFSGSSTGTEPSGVYVWVNRADMAAGVHQHTFTVYSTYGRDTVTVRMTVL